MDQPTIGKENILEKLNKNVLLNIVTLLHFSILFFGFNKWFYQTEDSGLMSLLLCKNNKNQLKPAWAHKVSYSYFLS